MVNYDDYNLPVSLADGHTATAEHNGNTGTLDLDTVIGNVNGALSWGGSGFTNGAQNVQITEGGHVLGADLPDGNGNMVHSELIIGAGPTSHDGQEAMHFGVVPPYSEAHAEAHTNQQADEAAHSQMQAADSTIVAVQTLQGNAADYWPEGNAPAAGIVVARAIVKIAVHVITTYASLHH